MFAFATSFWWWILIALWHSITKRGSIFEEYFVEEIFFFMGSFYVLELVELFRLYLGASLCIYILFWLLMYFLIGGDTFFFICFLFHFLLIYIYELFMIYVFALCFVKSRIYFCFTCIFHTCVCWVFQEIYKLIQSCCYLLLQLIDSS